MCGSRGWKDTASIGQILDELLSMLPEKEQLVLIHGGCPSGADKIAHDEASKRQITTIVEKADWNRHGKAAGPIRNQLMLDEHKPDVTYAFRSGGKSSGTDDMVKRSKKAEVPTYIIQVDLKAQRT